MDRETKNPCSTPECLGCISVFFDLWNPLWDPGSSLALEGVGKRGKRPGTNPGGENEAGGWKPGKLIFSGLAAESRNGADFVACGNDTGCISGCMGKLLSFGNGNGSFDGWFYRIRRHLGAVSVCSNRISAGAVLYAGIFHASFVVLFQREAGPGGCFFDFVVCAGDGGSDGSVAESRVTFFFVSHRPF